MHIVIDIPEEIRIAITRMGLLRIPNEMLKVVDKTIQSGKQLPKGHGRLIDADKLPIDIEWDDIEKSPTIIEAGRSEEDADTN